MPRQRKGITTRVGALFSSSESKKAAESKKGESSKVAVKQADPPAQAGPPQDPYGDVLRSICDSSGIEFEDPRAPGYTPSEDDLAKLIQALLPGPHQLTEVCVLLPPHMACQVTHLAALLTAFSICRRLRSLNQEARVVCIVDRDLPIDTKAIDRTIYELRTRSGDIAKKSIEIYHPMLSNIGRHYMVAYAIRCSQTILESTHAGEPLKHVIRNYTRLNNRRLSPEGKFAFNFPCEHCGATDKWGVQNNSAADGSWVSFRCPQHERYRWCPRMDLDHAHRLQFTHDMWNVVLGCIYQANNVSWIDISNDKRRWQKRISESVDFMPAIVVAPPVIKDLHGTTMDDEYFLRHSPGHREIKAKGMEYLIDFGVWRKEERKIWGLARLIEGWVANPRRLEQSFTLNELHRAITELETVDEEIYVGLEEPTTDIEDDGEDLADEPSDKKAKGKQVEE